MRGTAGFTLVELLVVVMILAIIGMMALPMVSGSVDAQCEAAARTLVSDIELAQSTALARQAAVALVFSDDRQSYKVVLAEGQDLDDFVGLNALEHPLKAGSDYLVWPARDMGLGQVVLGNVDFGGEVYVVFNAFGSPDSGGSVEVTAGSASLTVSVEAITGAVSVD